MEETVSDSDTESPFPALPSVSREKLRQTEASSLSTKKRRRTSDAEDHVRSSTRKKSRIADRKAARVPALAERLAKKVKFGPWPKQSLLPVMLLVQATLGLKKANVDQEWEAVLSALEKVGEWHDHHGVIYVDNVAHIARNEAQYLLGALSENRKTALGRLAHREVHERKWLGRVLAIVDAAVAAKAESPSLPVTGTPPPPTTG
jgi:hypothetical protein